MTDTKPETEFNLEHYLKNLTLQPMVHTKLAPLMPPPGGRSLLTPLVMRPGGYRNLEDIKPLDYLEDEATFFFNNLKLSMEHCEEVKSLKLTSQIPAQEMTGSFIGNPYEVDSDSGALFLIQRAPIISVQRLVETINPELKGLKFYSPSRCATLNAQKINPIFYCSRDEYGTLGDVKCIVVALPPWRFSPQDFEDFTTMDWFEDGCTSLNGTDTDPQWYNADRMWAYLHDLCLMHDCHHFVLTAYDQSAFGAFSNYYTTGFVSRAIPWDSEPNSVQELFTYWILDACRTQNTVIMEKVPREKDFDSDTLEKIRNVCRQRLGHMNAGPNLITDEPRPHKRARKDPLEDDMGWLPLNQHVDALFKSSNRPHFLPPQESQPSKSISARSSRESWTEVKDDVNMFVRPFLRWNTWYNKRKRESEENEIPEQGQNDKSLDEPPNLTNRSKFGHPIPCYSSDIDRNNDRFRPELVRLASFPIPTPK